MNTRITMNDQTTLELDEDWSTLSIHRLAVDVLRDAETQVRMIGIAYGQTDRRTVKAATSLAQNVARLFGGFFGQHQKITRDGDLSLFVGTSSGFVYGMIFHPAYYDPLREHPKAIDNSTGAVRRHVHCRTCDEPVKRTEPNAHDDHLLMLAATPGDWSFHS